MVRKNGPDCGNRVGCEEISIIKDCAGSISTEDKSEQKTLQNEVERIFATLNADSIREALIV